MKRLLGLLLLVMVMGSVGCGGSLNEEEKGIVGSYEQLLGDETYRWILLDNRSYKKHFPDMDVETGTWVLQDGFHEAFDDNFEIRKVKHKEVHAKDGDGSTVIFRVTADGSLKTIAGINENGQRMQIPTGVQDHYKKQQAKVKPNGSDAISNKP